MEKIEKLLEEIDSLTVIELSEFVKGIEEKYGVSAAAVAATVAGEMCLRDRCTVLYEKM